MNSLTTKVQDILILNNMRDVSSELTAQSIISAVLDHFSDQANVTDKMSDAAGIEFERIDVPDTETYDTAIRRAIAAAMKAAKEELK